MDSVKKLRPKRRIIKKHIKRVTKYRGDVPDEFVDRFERSFELRNLTSVPYALEEALWVKLGEPFWRNG